MDACCVAYHTEGENGNEIWVAPGVFNVDSFPMGSSDTDSNELEGHSGKSCHQEPYRVSSMQPATGPPPTPTIATSQSFTWRSPHSPRNWRHASATKPKPCSRPPESC